MRREFGDQSFGGDYRLRAKRHLRKGSRRYNTDRGSVRESASASASVKRGVGLGVQATLTALRFDQVTNNWSK